MRTTRERLGPDVPAAAAPCIRRATGPRSATGGARAGTTSGLGLVTLMGCYSRTLAMKPASASATTAIERPTTPPMTFDIMGMFILDNHTEPSAFS